MTRFLPICFLGCLIALAGLATSVSADDPGSTITDITWKLGPNLPEFRKGGAATAFGDRVISVFGMRQPWGEMATMYVYNPRTDAWKRAPDAPIGQTYVQGTEWSGAFYTIGGRSAPLDGVHRQCYRLAPKGNAFSWTRIADLNEPRGWAPSAAVDGKLFVFGGSKGGHGPTLGSVEMLDTAQPTAMWKKIAEIPRLPRGWCGAAAAGGKIYLIGGTHFFNPKPATGNDRKRLADVWQFDPEMFKWKAKRPLPFRLGGFDSCVYQDRYLIVTGGVTSSDDLTPEMLRQQKKNRYYRSYYSPFVLVYDTTTDRWQRMPSLMPVATHDVRVVISGKTLYALGGENIEPATSNTTPWLRIGTIQLREP